MEVNRFSGKSYDETLKLALQTLNANEDEVIIYSEEKKSGLFKSTTYELTVTPLTDIVEYIKDYLNGVLTAMGLNVSFETRIRDRQIQVKMYSDDNPILIGKQGRTLSCLQTVVRQAVKAQFGATPYVSLDVENYKDKQIMYLEKTAKRIAKEVVRTKVAVEMDNMNAYERLVVHNALADFKGIYTESTGEEPNRHVVIKPKEE